MEFIKEFFAFLKQRKKLWLIPIIFLFFAVGILVYISSGSALAPFIYTLF